MDTNAMDTINRRVVEQFRSGGPVDGMHWERLLLLTTTGRRSGRSHTVPMMFHRDGDRVLVVASAAGAAEHPDWYLNLEADPSVSVELPDRTMTATAEVLAGEDRAQTWSALVEAYPFFADHQTGIERQIPIVVLKPRSS